MELAFIVVIERKRVASSLRRCGRLFRTRLPLSPRRVQTCCECRYLTLPVTVRNHLTESASFISCSFKKQAAKYSHRGPAMGMSGAGWRREGDLNFSSSWFVVNGSPGQNRAALLSRTHKVLYRVSPTAEITTHGVCWFSFVFLGVFLGFFFFFPGERRWRTESGSSSRDWPLESVLKMEAVIERECSALGGLFQTVIGDMKVRRLNFTLGIITYCYWWAAYHRLKLANYWRALTPWAAVCS